MSGIGNHRGKSSDYKQLPCFEDLMRDASVKETSKAEKYDASDVTAQNHKP